MPRYKITTLVDITRTQATNNSNDIKKKLQQSNFNTLLQTIGLRANITWQKDPSYHHGVLPEPFDGKASFWTWEFEVEQEYLFEKDNDPVGLLLDDLHGVPVISNLDNSIEIHPSVFQIFNDDKNIWVELVG